ncbi:MAG: alpha/beta fold hydrolase [Bacteroidota bacterium]
MKRSSLAIAALCCSMALSAQTRGDKDLAVSKFRNFYNSQQPDSVFAMFSARIQGLIPADKTKEMLTQLYGKLGKFEAYEFSKEEGPLNYYKSVFATQTVSLMISLNSEHKLETFRFVPYQADTVKSNFILNTATGNIYGTLTAPDVDKKVPVVMIIAGSGPTDRNCNQPGMTTNAYKMLADSLLKYNIATVRYDKRGVGESLASGLSEEKLSFDDMIDDAAAMIKKLQGDKRFSKVIVLGHSEGSLVGMGAALKMPPAAFISVAGAGERADKVIEKQYAAQAPKMAAEVRVAFDSLIGGYNIKNPSPALASIFRPSVQGYLRSWLRHDPQVEIRKLKQPVLIVQGATDIQVKMENAEMLKKAQRKARLEIIQGMNHPLKAAPEDRQKNILTYDNPSLPLAPGLVPALVKFISQIP